MYDLQYPIGKPSLVTDHHRYEWINDIANAPVLLRTAIAGLTEEQLDTVYRPGGWTLRQVVHHVADSHVNAYIRFRWALTEENPVIKDYDEKSWAHLPDACLAPVDLSLALLEALHARWVLLLRSLSEEDMTRSVVHPENGTMSVDDFLRIYAWHGRHHAAHITSLRERMKW